ncbi:hypothetical protein KJ359_012163 [Pestalotiopsis sp. 9143b]|nr:hypothetical protein KJ359_012163 [Pestalotiopsis sp. 9143b]
MSAQTASQAVSLAPDQTGICPSTQDISPEAVQAASRLLQKNHDENHIFWRDFAGHNHTAHNVLTRLALGADETELESGYVDNKTDQRPRPSANEQTISELATDDGFHNLLGQVSLYTDYLVFFEREIAKKGWKEVIQEYCFSRTRNADAILARLFEGAFHPVIHLGLGIEFEQPTIVAEALAQAASDHAFGAGPFMRNVEATALQTPDAESRRLVDLVHEVRSNDKTRTAARWDDLQWKMKNGVLGRGMEDIVAVAAQYRVKPETLERQTAEMISCCSYFTGAAQRPGKARKLDFFLMHDVTSSIFNTVFNQQSWISIEDKVRLLEHKARFDLVWYATCGAPELRIEDIQNFSTGDSVNWGWEDVFRVAKGLHDDGHVAKFVRAVKNGEEVSKAYGDDDSFPVRGDMWLKLARMAYETTVGLPDDQKWLPFVGFDQPWGRIPDLK